MVALLGVPFLKYLKSSETSTEYFDKVIGKWKSASEMPSSILESFEKQLTGLEKIDFLDFIRKI